MSEECQSGRSGRIRNPVCGSPYRGFESHLLRLPDNDLWQLRRVSEVIKSGEVLRGLLRQVLNCVLKGIIHTRVIIHRHLHGRMTHQLVEHRRTTLSKCFRYTTSKTLPQLVH